MFHQIRIRIEDTHRQRFLFRFEKNQDPDVYLMDVATFGATCSPCSAQYIMHHYADEHAKEYPIAAAAIKRSTYMDDYFDSCDTKEEAIERAEQVKYVHAQPGLNMRNWVSNDHTLLERLQENQNSQTLITFKLDMGKKSGNHKVR